MNTVHEHAGLETVLASVIQDFMRFMHETGLSRQQIHALLHIFHAGECPISDIAVLTESSPAAASQLVERLVQQGLVQRTEDPQNRRVKKLRLTEKSRRLIRQGVTSNRSLAELIEAMPAKHRQTVQAGFGYLAEASQRIHSPKRKVEQHA